MGSLVRQYWIPALLSSELPEPKCTPVSIRLLGEDLTGFRTSDGRVGLVQSNCPHRGAPLFYGRPEEDGIRCVYHGWMFAPSGQCLDMPNEPEDSNFRDKVRITAYPCEERGGIVWTYMGPEEELPPLPALEWNMLPDDQVYLTKRIENCNFMQALEGEIDSSHSTFLHSTFANEGFVTPVAVELKRSMGQFYRMQDKRPRFQVADSDCGVMIGASYRAEADERYLRVTQFLLPFHTLIPPYGESPSYSGHAWVPIDDEHTMALCFTYHPARPLSEEQLSLLRDGAGGLEGLHPSANAFDEAPRIPGDAAWRTKLTHSRGFPVDWASQLSKVYSGLPGVWPQDAAMQEGMGPIYNRSQEHLGTTDMGIIRVRKRLLGAARRLDETGGSPDGSGDPEQYMMRAASLFVAASESWIDASMRSRKGQPGVSYDTP
jgi:phthalate 4,5-dioxygenase oxygenase subunit